MGKWKNKRVIVKRPKKDYHQPRDEVIECLECGKLFQALSGTHLTRIHNTNIRQYKEKHNIPYTTALISPTTKKKLRNNMLLRSEKNPEIIRRFEEGRLKASHPSIKRKLLPASREIIIKVLKESAKVRHKIIEDKKPYYLNIFKSVYKKVGRRPRREDFDKETYSFIKDNCGGIGRVMLEVIGYDLPLERPWLRSSLSKEQKQERKKEYGKKYFREHREEAILYYREWRKKKKTPN